MINEVISTLLQILAFSLIPFIVYRIKNGTVKGFFKYVGLTKSTKKANFIAIFASLLFAAPMLLLTLINSDFKEIMFGPNSITGKFRQLNFGVSSASILIVIAVFKTSFAEELLFRGFVAKRLISVLEYRKGNLVQAAIFGIIHAILFSMTTSNPLFLFLIFLSPSIGAYVSVYLNEIIANGSIIPGWISHAIANLLAYSIVGFVL